MKKILLIVLGLAAGSASFAKTDDSNKPSASASVINNEKIKLTVAPMNAKARVDLTDFSGHVLYSNNVNLEKGSLQIFDISALEKGEYQLSISVGKERVTKTLDIGETVSRQLVAIQN